MSRLVAIFSNVTREENFKNIWSVSSDTEACIIVEILVNLRVFNLRF